MQSYKLVRELPSLWIYSYMLMIPDKDHDDGCYERYFGMKYLITDGVRKNKASLRYMLRFYNIASHLLHLQFGKHLLFLIPLSMFYPQVPSPSGSSAGVLLLSTNVWRYYIKHVEFFIYLSNFIFCWAITSDSVTYMHKYLSFLVFLFVICVD